MDRCDTPQWEGQVLEVWDGGFSAELSRDGAPTVVADFDWHQLPDAQPGDLVTVTPTSVQRKDLGRWTQAELDAARRRASQRADKLAQYCE